MISFLRKMFEQEVDIVISTEHTSFKEYVTRLSIIGILSISVAYLLAAPFVIIWFTTYAIGTYILRLVILHLEKTRQFHTYIYVLLINLSLALLFRSMAIYFWVQPQTVFQFVAIVMILATVLFSVTQRSNLRTYVVVDGGNDTLVLLFFAYTFILDGQNDPYAYIGAVATSGIIAYHWVVLRDVLLMRSALLQAQNSLIQSEKNAAIGRLTAGVAHEYNNIMTAVMGNLELLHEIDDPNEKKIVAQEAYDSAERAALLTSRLLAFSRQTPLIANKLNIRLFFEKLSQQARYILSENIRLKTTAPTGVWAIRVDYTQFEKAIRNILQNAGEAMPDGGDITLTARNIIVKEDDDEWRSVKEGPYVLIAISDTGVGIADDIAKNIFDPFFTTKKVGQGAGLGLSMAKGFLVQSNGQLTVASEQGHGTTVSLLLPATMSEDIVIAPPDDTA